MNINQLFEILKKKKKFFWLDSIKVTHLYLLLGEDVLVAMHHSLYVTSLWSVAIFDGEKRAGCSVCLPGVFSLLCGSSSRAMGLPAVCDCGIS